MYRILQEEGIDLPRYAVLNRDPARPEGEYLDLSSLPCLAFCNIAQLSIFWTFSCTTCLSEALVIGLWVELEPWVLEQSIGPLM